jgi:photosystem II stability/assembly factor-like uncharacterized protein
MKNPSLVIRRKSAASAAHFLVWAAATGIALQAFTAPPLKAQPPLKLPHKATVWTPLPAHPIQPALIQPLALSSKTWTAIGPAPQASFNQVSGRIVGIAPHPAVLNTLFVAAAGGGVWETTNGGTSWTRLTDQQQTLSMGAISIGTNNNQTIYAGTGEANNSGDSNFGRGILISQDGGTSWTLSTAFGAFDGLTTSQIAVDPTDATVAYAAMADFGLNGAFGNTGIWKTTDTGATWTNTTALIDSLESWSAVVINPKVPSILYAAVGDIFGATTNGVYKSTNGGATWTLLTNAPKGTAAGRIAIAISPTNPSVIYVTATSTNPATFGALYKIMRSNNGGSTFTDLTAGTPNYMGFQGWYDTVVAVDPSNPATVYVAGSAGTNSILRSTNSGVTWTDISSGGATPHADHHAGVFNAIGRYIDGDDGGIYRLKGVGPTSWADLNGNLETIQFEGIGLHPTDRNKAIGGSQDNGTAIYTGGVVWTETDGGDGGFAKFSQTNGNRAYHQIPVASFGPNFFRRSDDGGNTWTTKTSSIVADINNQNFYAPFVVAHYNGDVVLYGTNNVWETTNGGDNWTALTTPGVNGWNPSGSNVDAIGISPSISYAAFIYAEAGGHIFLSADGGTNWTDNSIPGNPFVQDLQVDPSNPLIAYAVINAFNPSGTVFRTTNGGATWTNISSGLPFLPMWSLQIGGNGSILYVGADDGVYRTTNLGASWTRFGKLFPRAQVYQLELSSSLHILGAATHGRSMFEITVK